MNAAPQALGAQALDFRSTAADLALQLQQASRSAVLLADDLARAERVVNILIKYMPPAQMVHARLEIEEAAADAHAAKAAVQARAEPVARFDGYDGDTCEPRLIVLDRDVLRAGMLLYPAPAEKALLADLDLGAQGEQAWAWRQVTNVLDEVAPGWTEAASNGGLAAAAAISRLAAAARQATLDAAVTAADTGYLNAQGAIHRGEFSQPVRQTREAIEKAIRALAISPATLTAPSEQFAAARDVLAERRRQVEEEGWTPDYDDVQEGGELAEAAMCYADPVAHCQLGIPHHWPWVANSWKPRDRRHNLVRAGALIIAEIERLDRADSSEIAQILWTHAPAERISRAEFYRQCVERGFATKADVGAASADQETEQ